MQIVYTEEMFSFFFYSLKLRITDLIPLIQKQISWNQFIQKKNKKQKVMWLEQLGAEAAVFEEI